MVVKFSGLTNIPGKTIISLLSAPPEPVGFYKDTTTNRITSPSTSFTTALPGSVVEDDLLVLYHITSDDVTQTISNPVPLTLLNPGAESLTANWINQIGSLSVRTSSPSPHSGSRYWWGGSGSGQRLAYQDVVLPAEFITEADAGQLTITLGWWQNSRFGNDKAELQVEFYDGFPGSIIGAKVLGGLITVPAFNWVKRSFNTAIPPLTRTVRVFINIVSAAAGNNNGLVDDITVNIFGSSVVGWVPLWQNIPVTDECTTSCYTKLAGATEPSTVRHKRISINYCDCSISYNHSRKHYAICIRCWWWIC